MSKTQLKLGLCIKCGATLIVPIGDEFYCNRWGCFKMNILKGQESCYDIRGMNRLVHDLYHKACPYCDGDGLDADDDDEGKTTPRRKCPQCNGKGFE